MPAFAVVPCRGIGTLAPFASRRPGAGGAALARARRRRRATAARANALLARARGFRRADLRDQAGLGRRARATAPAARRYRRGADRPGSLAAREDDRLGARSRLRLRGARAAVPGLSDPAAPGAACRACSTPTTIASTSTPAWSPTRSASATRSPPAIDRTRSRRRGRLRLAAGPDRPASGATERWPWSSTAPRRPRGPGGRALGGGRHGSTGSTASSRPWLRMTAPPGLARRDASTELEPGRPAGRSWLLLGGLLPVDYDDLCLIEIDPPRAASASGRGC